MFETEMYNNKIFSGDTSPGLQDVHTLMASTTSEETPGSVKPDTVNVELDPGGEGKSLDFTVTTPSNPDVRPLDLTILQDLSGSFNDDVKTMDDLAPNLANSIVEMQSDTQFGVASFVDKPISPFGSKHSGDYEYQTDLALTEDKSKFVTTIQEFDTHSGSDGNESQLSGLLQLAERSEELGWRPEAKHVVILSTDAGYHKAGDGSEADITTENNGDNVLDGDPPGTAEDYPSVEQVGNALQDANIVPLFAVTDRVNDDYQELVDEWGFGHVSKLKSDSSDMVNTVDKLITESSENISLNAHNDESSFVESIEPAEGFEDVAPGTGKTFTVNLSADSGVESGSFKLKSPGIGETVVNVTVGGEPELSVSNVTIDPEGDSGEKTAQFDVSLSEAPSSPVSYEYNTAEGTAATGDDYGAVSGTITFEPDGETSKTVEVPVFGDEEIELNEDFYLELSQDSKIKTTGKATIIDDDKPQLSIDDTSVEEGDSGTSTATFTVDLNKAPSAEETVTVDYSTADGSAKAGKDYKANSGTLTFNKGETSKEISVSVQGDTSAEKDEDFFLKLKNVSGKVSEEEVGMSKSEGVGTILDDDTSAVDQVLVPAEPDGYQLGRDGNDYYVVSDNVGKDARTTAVDTEGSNRVQMIDWLDIDSFKAASTQLILTMDNGHEVDIRSANQFDYELGANATTGDTGDVVSYETLLTDSLGLDAVPGEGEVKEGGSTTIIPNKVEIEGNTETNKGVEESFVYEYEYKDGKLVSQEEELVQIDEFTREDTLVLKSMGEEGVDSLSGLKDAITVSEAPIEDKTSLTFNETEETAASTLELMGIVDDTLETIDIAFA